MLTVTDGGLGLGQIRPLVIRHLEDASRDTLAKYQDIIRGYIRGKHGIYALYKKDRLYYVGLASSLGGRLKQHLRDRHGASWDRFSVYLTRRAEQIKELESIVLRIVKPIGNKQLGKFPGSSNLASTLRDDIRARYRAELDRLVRRRRPPQSQKRTGSRTGRRSRDADPTTSPPIRAYTNRRMSLRGTVNGKPVKARVLGNGWIRYRRYDYHSPTAAATAAAVRRTNGWYFWHFQKSPGNWVRLGEIR
jgi:hypothetical protein